MAVLGSFVLCTYLLLHVMSTEQSLLPASGQAWSPSEAGEFLWGSLLGRGKSTSLWGSILSEVSLLLCGVPAGQR